MSKKATKKMIANDVNNAVAVYIAAFYEEAEAKYDELRAESDKGEEIWQAAVHKLLIKTKKGKAFLAGAVAKSFHVSTSYRHLYNEGATLTLHVRDRNGFSRIYEFPQSRALVKLKVHLSDIDAEASQAKYRIRRQDAPRTAQSKVELMRELMGESPKLRRTILKAVEKAIGDLKK